MKRYFILGFLIAAWPANSLAQIKVACISNSITAGSTLTSPSTQAYPAVLQKLLGSGYQVQNDGVSALSFDAPAGASYTVMTADAAGKTLVHVNGVAAGPVTCAIHRGESAPRAALCVIRIDGRIRAVLRSMRPEASHRP